MVVICNLLGFFEVFNCFCCIFQCDVRFVYIDVGNVFVVWVIIVLIQVYGGLVILDGQFVIVYFMVSCGQCYYGGCIGFIILFFGQFYGGFGVVDCFFVIIYVVCYVGQVVVGR